MTNRATEMLGEGRHEQTAALSAKLGPFGGFKLVNAEEIFAPLAEPEYLVEGLIRRGSVVLLGGYGSSGKTWIAVDLLLSVALSALWVGLFKANEGRATFLDYESGKYEFRRRLVRCAQGRQLKEPKTAEITACFMPEIYMTQQDFEARVEALARERELIIIDSLLGASPGVQENESTVRVGLDGLRRIAERTGCTFVVLVHAKKTSGTQTKIDPREVLRGSSAIFDAADAAFIVTHAKDAPFRVEQNKNRHGRETDPFEVSLIDTDSGDGILLTGLRVADDLQLSRADQATEACNAVYEVIAANPGCSKRFILDHAKGIGTTRGAAAVKQLLDERRIQNNGSTARAAYTVTDADPGKEGDE